MSLPVSLTAALVTAASCFAQPAAEPGQPAGAADQPAGQAAAAPALTPLGHVEQRGSGPVPMVLIPGLACDWTVYDSFMTRNTERYTMYAVTLPGFGGSTPPPAIEGKFSEQPWLANAEAAVLAMIEEKGLDKPLVVGHSIGGHLALRLAAHRADQLRAAISLDGAGAFPLGDPSQPIEREQRLQIVEGMIAPQISMMDQETWKMQMEMGSAQMVTNPERAVAIGKMCGEVPVATSGRYMLELMAADISEELKTNSTRTLVVAAIAVEENPMVPNQAVRDWWTASLKEVPGSTVVFFEGTRHFITEDAPAELDRAVEQFVNGQTVEGKAAPAPDAEKPAETPPEKKPE